MSYRQCYWKKVVENLSITWTLFWNGVVMNRRHHSKWDKEKSCFYRK